MTKHKQRRLALLLGAAALAAAAWCGILLCAPAALSVSAASERSFPPDSGEMFRLDLNTASVEELETLPGIGPVLAERIVERRQELGAFRTREDVLSVYGIGEATYEKIEPYITCG